MRFRKLLLVISIIIVSMFALMLTTSYAWYSFGGTTFDAVTSAEDIEVTYQSGEYISNNAAVPINSDEIEKYSDKGNFNVKVNSNKEDVMISVKLTDITIDSVLINSNLKIELYYQGTKVSTVDGSGIVSGEDLFVGNVVLEDISSNQFEVRMYILDDNSNQNTMMDKSFKAKIKVDAISRLNPEFTDFTNADIYVDSITIDGEESKYIPTEGIYDMTSTCVKGSNLSWDSLKKIITYDAGFSIQDVCSLTFVNGDYPLLNTMEVGSYVNYVGNNGCDEKHCDGNNANYVNDNDMGYCSNSSSYKFLFNGWRIGYIQDDSVYLVSAGAPECVRTLVGDTRSSSGGYYFSSELTFNAYYYGTGYSYNEETGYYSLTGVSDTTLDWSSRYSDIISTYKYTCKSTSSTGTCAVLYEISSSATEAKTSFFQHTGYDTSKNHIAHLNELSLKYCNSNYVYGGVCDNSSVWAFNDTDFQIMTNSTSSTCNQSYSNKSCGYGNDLIDVGSLYWIATSHSTSTTYQWFSSRLIGNYYATNFNGVRPVIRLDSNVFVNGGLGTYDSPYEIGI